MFLFWKILTCSTPKDTYKKVIEHDYLWIWVHLYETILLLGKNCGQKLQIPVWSFGKLKSSPVLKVSILSPFAMLVVEKGTNKLWCHSAKKLHTPSLPQISYALSATGNSIVFSSSVFSFLFHLFHAIFNMWETKEIINLTARLTQGMLRQRETRTRIEGFAL